MKQLNKDAIKPPQNGSDSDNDSIIEIDSLSCLICGTIFNEEPELEEHIAREHITSGLQRRLREQDWVEGGACPECGEVEDVVVHWGVRHGHVKRMMRRWVMLTFIFPHLFLKDIAAIFE